MLEGLFITLIVLAIALFAAIGVGLTLLGLPGIWLTILVAGIAWLIRPDTFTWWTFGACVALGLLAELLEFILSAAGAAKAGGSKRAALASIVGGVIGGIVGSPFLFPIGTIIGAAIGAGLGAGVFEATKPGRTLEQSYAVGQGAAVGRLVATVVKSTINVVIALILVLAAVIP
ncbi:MAG: DUF456 family protein [Phycisphaerales bacterium]